MDGVQISLKKLKKIYKLQNLQGGSSDSWADIFAFGTPHAASTSSAHGDDYSETSSHRDDRDRDRSVSSSNVYGAGGLVSSGTMDGGEFLSESNFSASVTPTVAASSYIPSTTDYFQFKLRDVVNNKTHRFSSGVTLGSLVEVIQTKTGIPFDDIQIHYEDDEKDLIHLHSDSDLFEAVGLARRCTWNNLCLIVGDAESYKVGKRRYEEKKKQHQQTLLVGAGVMGVALAAIVGFVLLKSK